MTDEPRWLTLDMVLAIHDEQLATFGGGAGIRDMGLLESALGRPVNRFGYDAGATVFELAAAYAFGIVRNHPFVDGNKRTGLLAVHAFLFLNDWHFDPDQSDEVKTFLALGAVDVEEVDLAKWIAANAEKTVG